MQGQSVEGMQWVDALKRRCGEMYQLPSYCACLYMQWSCGFKERDE